MALLAAGAAAAALLLVAIQGFVILHAVLSGAPPESW